MVQCPVLLLLWLVPLYSFLKCPRRKEKEETCIIAIGLHDVYTMISEPFKSISLLIKTFLGFVN